MRWKILSTKNSISVTVEKVIITADTKEEALAKAYIGDYDDIEIIECSDVAELSSEFSEPKQIE